jgi:hypothetical protein
LTTKSRHNKTKKSSRLKQNRTSALPKLKEQEQGEWPLLKEKLADLSRKKISTKRLNLTKIEMIQTAIKDEIVVVYQKFGDLQWAARFSTCKDVHDYARALAKALMED